MKTNKAPTGANHITIIKMNNGWLIEARHGPTGLASAQYVAETADHLERITGSLAVAGKYYHEHEPVFGLSDLLAPGAP